MTGVADQFKRRQQQSIWHTLNRLVVALIAFALITAILCAFLPTLRARSKQVERVEALRAEIASQRVALNRRLREVELLRNDPSYVEIVARDRLDMMKEGETIFRLDAPPHDTSGFVLRAQ